MSADPLLRLLPAFGTLPIQRRVERNWTVETLADVLQSSVGEVNSMQRGEYGPTLPEFFRIARVFGEEPVMMLIDLIATWRGDDADRSLYPSRPSSFERLYRLGYHHKIGDFREQERPYSSVAEATHNADRLNRQRRERGVKLLDTMTTYVRTEFICFTWEPEAKSDSGETPTA